MLSSFNRSLQCLSKLAQQAVLSGQLNFPQQEKRVRSLRRHVSGGIASKQKGHSSSGQPRNRERSGASSAAAIIGDERKRPSERRCRGRVSSEASLSREIIADASGGAGDG